MISLKNPFAVRNDTIIMIEDLTPDERGLKCRCQCPSCDGNFIAKMGDVNIHHFSHSKDACDEVLAYTSGLYRLMQQIFKNGVSFYVPPLIVSYSLAYGRPLNKNEIDNYIKYIYKMEESHNNIVVVSEGKDIEFENAELYLNSKNHIEALELTYMGRKMAIKVMPPNTVCKMGTVSVHKDIATLVLDFTADGNKIRSFSSALFEKYLLSEKLTKYWIYNPKVQSAYSQILAHSQKDYDKHLKEQRLLEEKKKLASQKTAIHHTETNKYTSTLSFELKKKEGYKQVKDKFAQQTEQIWDSFGNRWIQCKVCGERKISQEFLSYGGLNEINLGICKECTEQRN